MTVERTFTLSRAMIVLQISNEVYPMLSASMWETGGGNNIPSTSLGIQFRHDLNLFRIELEESNRCEDTLTLMIPKDDEKRNDMFDRKSFRLKWGDSQVFHHGKMTVVYRGVLGFAHKHLIKVILGGYFEKDLNLDEYWRKK